MIRKLVCLLSFVIICVSSMSVLAQDQSPSDRLIRARAQYYAPTTDGLKSFRCKATIDWRALLSRARGTETRENDPLLKALRTVHLSVVDQLRGNGSIEWSNTGVPPKGQEEALKQMHRGLQLMMTGFFQIWNPYMNGSIVPIPDKSIKFSRAGPGFHLHLASTNTEMDEDFDQNMVLTKVVASSPEGKTVQMPTYVRFRYGLAVSAIAGQISQPASAPPVYFTIRVAYAKVDSFRIPSHVVYIVNNATVVEVGLNSCQVSVADWAQKPRTEKSNQPTE